MPAQDEALLLLGHGSTLNADSSAPTYQHAEEIARRGVFAEVHVGFWKEEPNFRQALRQTRCRRVYIVPNFISSGYFTEQVIPRELGLSSPVTAIGQQEVCYCAPVGLSTSMTAVLLQRATDVLNASGEHPASPESTCLFICGHGTSLNDNSTKIIHEQAKIIRTQGIYGDCQAVLMEQRPFVKDWRKLTACPDVIVVPFFISDGLHSFEDIPVLLGLTHNMREKAFTNPHREGGRRLWYATAIGTEPAVADVILEQVDQFENEHSELLAPTSLAGSDGIAAELGKLLEAGDRAWKIGQVVIRKTAEGFELVHESDQGKTELNPLFALADLRELIRVDAKDNFRPLRAAPDLRNGWIMHAADAAELQAILDYLYPAEVANWMLWKSGMLEVTPWRETAERQSGRFRVVHDLGEVAVKELAAEVCDRGCLKCRLWSPVEQKAMPAPNEIPLLCPEACNYFVSKAREILKGPSEEE